MKITLRELRGMIRSEIETSLPKDPCRVCGGKGDIEGDHCAACGGSGEEISYRVKGIGRGTVPRSL